MRSNAGFTLVELVVTLIILGVLAVAVLPRFVGRDAFDVRGFADALTSSLAYARQQAVAQRRPVCVAVTVAGITVTMAAAFNGACNQPLIDPATGAGLVLNAPAGVVIAAAGLPFNITFDAAGRPDAGRVLTVPGETPRNVVVEAETGYVRLQ